MQEWLLHYKSSQINCYRFGTGEKIAICFHGYGEDGNMYRFLEKHSGDQFSFYSIDLPFHGKTKWNEGLLFTNDDLQQIILEILAENDQQLQTVNCKLSLIGFSLGGRIALSLYQAQPSSIEKLVLLAPDGLKVNFWYWLATQTYLGNKLFAFSMKHPGWFFGFIKLLNKLGVVNASIFKFVNYYIGNLEVRDLLYKRWTTLRKLKPDRLRIKNFIRQYKTPARLVYGKYDRIILPIRGAKFQEGIEEFCTVSIIHSGHQVLHENHVEGIMNALAY
jgi:pimeloyl-ACP methyl ester carboxylesterase